MGFNFETVEKLKDFRQKIEFAFRERHPEIKKSLTPYKNNPVLVKLSRETGIGITTLINIFYTPKLIYRITTIQPLQKYASILNANAHYRKGIENEEKYSFKTAFNEFKKSYELDPDKTEYAIKYAYYLRQFDDVRGSRMIFIKTLESEIRTKEEKSLFLCDIYFNIGMTYDYEENLPEAIINYDKALNIALSKQSKISTADISRLYNYASHCYLMTNNIAVAEGYNRQSLELLDGKNHKAHLGFALKVKAKICLHKGLIDEAVQSLNDSINLFESLKTPSKYRADIYSEMGAFLMDYKADFMHAISFFEKAMMFDEELWGNQTLRHVGHYHRIGDAYQRTKDFVKAKQWSQKALNLYFNLEQRDHLILSAIYNNLAICCWHEGNFKVAQEYWAIDLEMQRCNYPVNKDGLIITLSNLGFCSVHISDFGNAERKYSEALDISIELHGQEHILTCQVYNRIIAMYRKMNDKESALPLAKKISTILKEHIDKYGAAPSVIQTFDENMEWLKMEVEIKAGGHIKTQ